MASPTIVTKIRLEGTDEIRKAFEEVQRAFENSAKRMQAAGEKVGQGLKKGVESANTSVRATGTIGVRSFGLLRSAASGFLGILNSTVSVLASVGRVAVNIAGKVAAVGVAAFASVQAFGIMTGRTLDEMGRMARAAGVPVERFSRLATATRLLGGDVNDLSNGLQTLSDKIIDAAKDSEGGAAKAFAQLGISVRKSNGDIKTTEEVLAEVADGLAKVPSDTLRASAAVDIFGSAASKLLPLLENGASGIEKYASEADRLGTVVTDAQTRTSRELLVQYRKVGEALRGIAYRISDDLLPFLTRNSDALASWLAGNADQISEFVGRVFKEISGISADLGRALIGDSRSVEREWVRKLVPALTTAKNVLLDLLDLFTGGSATRAPWIKDVGAALVAAAAAAAAFAWGIGHAMGIAETDLPTLAGLAEFIRTAFESLRAGIEGSGAEAAMPWAANVGQTLMNLGSTFGTITSVIVDNREEITKFAADITALLAGAAEAMKALWAGDAVPSENPFAVIGEWRDWLVSQYRLYEADIRAFFAEVAGAFSTAASIARAIWEWTDWIAKNVGLGSGIQLSILLLIAHFTGFLGVLRTVLGILGSLFLSINGVLNLLLNLGGVARWLSGVFLWAAGGIAAALGLPVAAVAAIGLAIAALGFAVWYWWDEIVTATKWLAAMMWEGIKWVFDRFVAFFQAVWQWAVWSYEKITGAFGAMRAFFVGILEAVWEAFREFWAYIAAQPARAWDALVDIWGGFTGFFKGMIDSVAGWFKGLWDGVASGAQNAWGKVKGWFGFGEEVPSGGPDSAPGFASGGIVRGAGTGVSDSIRAWLSNGEGVLNARAVSHYGEGLVHALNGLLIPPGLIGGGVPVPAGGGGSGLAPFSLGIGGRGVRGSLYADSDAVRSLRRDFRSQGSAARGPAPRWRR